MQSSDENGGLSPRSAWSSVGSGRSMPTPLAFGKANLNKLRAYLSTVDIGSAEALLPTLQRGGLISEVLYAATDGSPRSNYACALLMFRASRNAKSPVFTAGIMALELSVECKYDRACLLYARGVYNKLITDSPFRAFAVLNGASERGPPGRLFGEIEALLSLFLKTGFGCEPNQEHAFQMLLAAQLFGF